MKSCGFSLDPGKSQIPASVWNALGVAFDMQTLRAQSKLNREPMHAVGAVLFIPGQEKPLYTGCAVPDEVVSR
jgi:hypothetical protein